MNTTITQIWMVCHLLPFAKVGQYCIRGYLHGDVVLFSQISQVRPHENVHFNISI